MGSFSDWAVDLSSVAWTTRTGLGLIPGHGYSAPYEDVKLKKR